MVELVAGELIADSPQWRDMTTHLRTVATQAFQLWLRPDEPTLGWHRPGVTTSGYVAPFDTWASMPQTLWAEQWPEDDRPRYGGLLLRSPECAVAQHRRRRRDYVAGCREKVLTEAVAYLDNHVGLYLPGAVTEQGFAWHLLVGANGHRGASALETQYVSVNIDPSDRYVQSVPGSDKYRLRSDESGYDNLVLAGDWTDSGYNAGCIEAAVMSGLQAANALLGRGRLLPHSRVLPAVTVTARRAVCMVTPAAGSRSSSTSPIADAGVNTPRRSDNCSRSRARASALSPSSTAVAA